MTLVDANPNCRFYVEIDNNNEAVFTEVSGFEVETDVTEYAEGGNNAFVHRLPGRIKAGNLTLKRGLTSSTFFYDWLTTLASGTIRRRNVTVVVYDVTGQKLMQWNFINAYPVRWTAPDFAADGTTVAVETLELTHDGVVLS